MTLGTLGRARTHTAPRADATHRLVVGLAMLVPILLYVYTALGSPRPYYVSEIDIEQDYYYNARLLYEGLPVARINHPGTPFYFLGSLLLSLSGAEPERAQYFFDIAYLCIALLTALGLGVFAYLLLRGVPLGIAILALVSAIAWPSFLTYTNYFGADSFIVAVGLPTIAFFWKSLEGGERLHRLFLFLSGVGIGVCLATKMTFLPVAAALVVAGGIHAWRARDVARDVAKPTNDKQPGRRLLRGAGRLLLMPTGVIISYAFFTVPVWNHLLTIWMSTFRRRESRVALEELTSSFTTAFRVLYEANFALALLLIAAFVASLYLAAQLLFQRLRSKNRGAPLQAPASSFDHLSTGVFLVLMALGFAYTMATSTDVTVEAQAGIRLRYASPSALLIPFLVLYCYRLLLAVESLSIRKTVLRGVAWVAAGVGALTIGVGLLLHIEYRDRFIKVRENRIAATVSRLEALSPQSRRVAFWTESNDDQLGAISFHFWGNYRYAYDRFDRELIDKYPRFTFFQLREIGKRSEESAQPEEASESGSRFGWLGNFIWDTFAAPFAYAKASQTVSGEQYGIRPAVIAFPVEERVELGSMTQAEFLSLIQERFGSLTLWEESVGGVEWQFIRINAFDNAGK